MVRTTQARANRAAVRLVRPTSQSRIRSPRARGADAAFRRRTVEAVNLGDRVVNDLADVGWWGMADLPASDKAELRVLTDSRGTEAYRAVGVV